MDTITTMCQSDGQEVVGKELKNSAPQWQKLLTEREADTGVRARLQITEDSTHVVWNEELLSLGGSVHPP